MMLAWDRGDGAAPWMEVWSCKEWSVEDCVESTEQGDQKIEVRKGATSNPERH